MKKCDSCGKEEPNLFLDKDSHEKLCEECYRGENL